MLHWKTKLVAVAIVALTLASLLDKASAFGFSWT
jgi:hypothetical protein